MSSKRASYAATFKKKVISVAESVGNREAARQFEISEANVRLWRKTKEQLLQQKPHSRASGRGKVAQFPEMEKELLEIIAEQRASGCAISTVELRLKALKIMKDKGNHEFKASANWCYLFMRRHGIPLKRRISIARLSTSFEDDLNTYQQVIFQLRKQHGYDISCIANADQTPLTFGVPCSHTIKVKDAKTVTIKSTGNEKNHFTVMLGAYGDGTKMIPYIIFKQKNLPNKCQWPNDVIVRCHPKGWMDEALTKDWIRSVWCKGKPLSRKMLVLDACRSNRMPAIKEILNENKTDLVLIPDGMTKQLQVMEVSCNRPFKHHMRQKWNEWMSSATQSFTAGGKTRKPELVEITTWIKEAWDAVSPDIISRGFKNCCLTNSMEGTEDDIQWDDGEDVDEPMHEYETLDQLVIEDLCDDASDVREDEADGSFEGFAAEDTDVNRLIGCNEELSPQQPLAIKEEEEDLPLHIKEEANDPQLPHIKVEDKSPQPPQLKEEEDDPQPLYIKVEDKEPQFLHVRQEEEAQQPPHVKEEAEDPQPAHVKQVMAAQEPSHIKEEEEEALSKLRGTLSVSDLPLPGVSVNSGNYDDKPPELSQHHHSSTPHVTTAADVDNSEGPPPDTLLYHMLSQSHVLHQRARVPLPGLLTADVPLSSRSNSFDKFRSLSSHEEEEDTSTSDSDYDPEPRTSQSSRQAPARESTPGSVRGMCVRRHAAIDGKELQRYEAKVPRTIAYEEGDMQYEQCSADDLRKLQPSPVPTLVVYTSLTETVQPSESLKRSSEGSSSRLPKRIRNEHSYCLASVPADTLEKPISHSEDDVKPDVHLVPIDSSATGALASAENVTCSVASCNERLKAMTAKIERLEQLLAKERREKKKLFKQKKRIELYVSKLFRKEPLDKFIRQVSKEVDC